MNYLISLNEVDLRHPSQLFNGRWREFASVAMHTITNSIRMPDSRHRVLRLLRGLQEVEMVVHQRRRYSLLEHDNVGVVDAPVRVLVLH